MRFIFEPKGENTVMHIERHNELGESLSQTLCGCKLAGRLRSINVSLGCPICVSCQEVAKRIREGQQA